MNTVKVSVSMAEQPHCPQCGTALPGGALGGLCPACLLRQGAAGDTGVGDKPERPGFTPPAVAELAKLFPQLEILELIGRGGMGAVYKARQPQLDRLVALKILPPGIGGDGAFAERFAREAKALAKLNHPGIVTLYEFGQVGWPATQEGGTALPPLYFFLMEYVDGVNLRQLLGKARVSPREALAIVPQICDALQFAHDQGIVHRDIKPENILLDRRGRVKVADFGLAKIVGPDAPSGVPASGGAGPGEPEPQSLTEAGKVMGTPDYMSPEQIQAPGGVDHRADIYALGVVFYEMLTGELPGKQLEPPSHRVQLDVRLDEVVLRALEEAPERRYQHASDLKTGVETIAGSPGAAGVAGRFVMPPGMTGVDYRSKTTWFGWPLVHVATGLDPETGKVRVARGIIAIGGRAHGVLALGGLAIGGIAIGGGAVGVVAIGGGAIGLVSIGGLAIALILALGGGAVAPIALGGGAIGYYAFGGKGIGAHVYDALGQDPAARSLFLPWAKSLMKVLPLANVVFLAVFLPLVVGLPLWLQRRGQRPASASVASGEKKAPPRTSIAQRIFRWSARVLGTILLALFVAIAIGEGLPPIWSQPEGVRVELVAMLLMVVGFVVGWRWDGWAAICLLTGSALFHIVEWQLVLGGALEFPTLVGALYLVSWGLGRKAAGRDGLGQPRRRIWPLVVGLAGVGGTVLVMISAVILYSVNRYAALKRTAEEARAADVSAQAGGAAGREVVLPATKGRHAELYDVDRAQWATNEVFGENDRETHAWLRARQLDLLGVIEHGQFAVLCMDMVVLPVASNSWQEVTSESLRTNQNLRTLEPGKITGVAPVEAKTDTWIFRTREDSLGVLQLLGTNANPSGVRIRYRLVPGAGAGVSRSGTAPAIPLAQLSPAAQRQAIAIFNDIEDFGHEFDAAFTARNIVAAQTGTRRLLNLLSNFNSVVKGTDCEFPAELFVAVGKVKAELDAGDLEAARRASQHNPAFAAEFKRIGEQVVALAKSQAGRGAPAPLLLEIRRVLDATETNTPADTLPSPHGGEPLRVEKAVLLGDDVLEKSRLSWSEHNKTWEIEILFTPAGTRQFADVTRTNLGRQLAILFNGRVLSAPVIRSEITGGKGIISGNFKFAEAADMVWRLNRGFARAQSSAAVATGPVFQLEDPGAPEGLQGLLALDLDAGRAVAWPPEIVDWNEGRILRWFVEAGVDVSVNSRHGRSLQSLAPALTTFSPDLWPRVPSRAELLQHLAPHIDSSEHQSVTLDGLPSPAVFAFCTTEGSVGLLNLRIEGTNTVIWDIKRSEQ